MNVFPFNELFIKIPFQFSARVAAFNVLRVVHDTFTTHPIEKGAVDDKHVTHDSNRIDSTTSSKSVSNAVVAILSVCSLVFGGNPDTIHVASIHFDSFSFRFIVKTCSLRWA